MNGRRLLPQNDNQTTSQNTSTPTPTVKDEPKDITKKIDTNVSSTATVDLWSIFDKNTLALKNKDIVAFNATSYIQVTSAEESQFAQMASFLYDQSIKINKNNYVNKWQDDKQAIYSTNPVKTDDSTAYGYKQGSIMFMKKDGSWKILLSSPERNWGVSKAGTNQTSAQVEQLLQAMMIDSDKDGLTNNEETCDSGAQQYNPNCVKSDPNKRDTNGNGWWDGIEANMK